MKSKRVSKIHSAVILRTRGYSSLSDCQNFPRVRNKRIFQRNYSVFFSAVQFVIVGVCVRVCFTRLKLEGTKSQVNRWLTVLVTPHNQHTNTDDQHCQRISIFVFHLFTSGRRVVFSTQVFPNNIHIQSTRQNFSNHVCVSDSLLFDH